MVLLFTTTVEVKVLQIEKRDIIQQGQIINDIIQDRTGDETRNNMHNNKSIIKTIVGGSAEAAQVDKKQNNYKTGHRKRMLEKMLNIGIANFITVEIIEYCLYLSIPRKNVKQIAYNLYEKYKSLYFIIGASKEDLLSVNGVGIYTYTTFQLLLGIIQHIQEEKIYEKEFFCTLEDVVAYCKWKMVFLTQEQLRVLYFNSKHYLIRDELQSMGTINQVSIYPREILKRAFELGAAGIVLCHNHPSGDVAPSKEDREATLRIKKIMDLLDIKLHDHIIIGEDKFFSMKAYNII